MLVALPALLAALALAAACPPEPDPAPWFPSRRARSSFSMVSGNSASRGSTRPKDVLYYFKVLKGRSADPDMPFEMDLTSNKNAQEQTFPLLTNLSDCKLPSGIAVQASVEDSMCVPLLELKDDMSELKLKRIPPPWAKPLFLCPGSVEIRVKTNCLSKSKGMH